MMLLLDSHVFLWWLQDSRRLGPRARRAVAAAGSRVFVSAASIWELAIKLALGKLRWRDASADGLDATIAACGFEELPVTARHAIGVRDLPPHHGDLFDRLLASQALVVGLRVVTADAVFEKYGVPVLPAES